MEAVCGKDLRGTIYTDISNGELWVVLYSGGDVHVTWWKLLNLETGEIFQLWDDYVRSDAPNNWLRKWEA